MVVLNNFRTTVYEAENDESSWKKKKSNFNLAGRLLKFQYWQDSEGLVKGF